MLDDGSLRKGRLIGQGTYELMTFFRIPLPSSAYFRPRYRLAGRDSHPLELPSFTAYLLSGAAEEHRALLEG